MVNVMPRITEERRARQRERVVEAMLESIRTRGLSSTSMADVIDGSGLSAGAIYGYFRGKDEILMAAASRIAQDRADVLVEASEQTPVPPPDEVLEQLLSSLPGEVLDGGALLQVWGESARNEELRELSADVIGRLGENFERYLRAWLVQEGDEEPGVHAQCATPALMALTQGYLVRSSLVGDLDPAGFAAAVRLLLRLS